MRKNEATVEFPAKPALSFDIQPYKHVEKASVSAPTLVILAKCGDPCRAKPGPGLFRRRAMQDTFCTNIVDKIVRKRFDTGKDR